MGITVNRRNLHKFTNKINKKLTAYITTIAVAFACLAVFVYPATTVLADIAFTEEEQEWINTHDSLRVGYLNNYLPYSGTDSDGEVTGMIKDITPAILEKLELTDIEVTYKGYDSYDDMTDDVVAGKLDVVFPVGGGAVYSEEDGINQSIAVISATTDLVYKDDLTEKEVLHFAVNENNKMQYYYIITNFPSAEITYYSSIDDCLEAVLSGEVDTTTLNGLRANDILKNREYNDLYLRQLSNPDERCFGTAIGNAGLYSLINKGISLVGTEYLQRIAFNYVGELYSYSAADVLEKYLPQFLVFIIVIILIFSFLIIRDLRRQRKASQLKTNFLSSMSHEIRTPITAILGMNEMIQMETDDENVLRYADNIEKAGNNLLGIINDILDISKIESGNIEIYDDEYNTADMISEICAMTSQSAFKKGLEFIVDIDANLPKGLIGDVKKFRQIIMNLLSNAVKYTREGSVTLSITLNKIEYGTADIHVAVKDTGIGIKDVDRDRVFREFDRLDFEKNNNIEGTGLGLAICRRMLEMMGSEINMQSVYGEGSEFYFDIRQKTFDETPIGDFDVLVRENAIENKETTTRTVRFKEANVLIVDDTPMNLSVISGLLKSTGLNIHTADGGISCLDMVSKEKFDLILLDQRMPKMDGIETLATLKREFSEEMRDKPVIALTANVLSGSKETMLKAGFTDYLSKPVKRETLIAMLTKYLETEEEPDESTQPDKLTQNDMSQESDDSAVLSGLESIGGLDTANGIAYCGDEEDYIYALELFCESVSDKSTELNNHFNNKDTEAFGVLIHSLKSTSKSIGASELSEKAAKLEQAADKNDRDYIEENTTDFIEEYRKLAGQIGKALTDN